MKTKIDWEKADRFETFGALTSGTTRKRALPGNGNKSYVARIPVRGLRQAILELFKVLKKAGAEDHAIKTRNLSVNLRRSHRGLECSILKRS
ncbi:MAG: hypothetical protein HY360_24610 [Verrucomicrobia bacterium]|nr:hypothetical protein [Verrucomicrobiota bacterium]